MLPLAIIDFTTRWSKFTTIILLTVLKLALIHIMTILATERGYNLAPSEVSMVWSHNSVYSRGGHGQHIHTCLSTVHPAVSRHHSHVHQNVPADLLSNDCIASVWTYHNTDWQANWNESHHLKEKRWFWGVFIWVVCCKNRRWHRRRNFVVFSHFFNTWKCTKSEKLVTAYSIWLCYQAKQSPSICSVCH